MSLPSADDLFRAADAPQGKPVRAKSAGASARVRAVPDAPRGQEESPVTARTTSEAEPGDPARRPSGRVRHDEKVTVYVTSEELLDIEHARLSLRRSHGLAVDRGRLVREAVAMVLADLEVHGEHSALVRRLSAQ